MRKYLLACLLACLLMGVAEAAVIRGVVVENLTSKPVARTMVTLEPVTGGERRAIRCSRLGAFEFDSLPAGTYVVKAARIGFMPAEYGQKRWNSAGTPMVLAADGSAFLNIRLLRYSAIRGTVADENDVGMPEHEVVAYRNIKPLSAVSRAVTDDRGVYSLHGLEPGTYIVRTTGKRYDDETYLPTFGRETESADQARTVEVTAEEDAQNADIHPFAGGRLYTLTVSAAHFPPDSVITLTIASELGRKSAQGGVLRVTDLPPGQYDLYAEATPPGGGDPIAGSYQRISLGGDMGVSLLGLPLVQIAVTGVPANAAGQVWARRYDLAGVGPSFAATMDRGAASLPLGLWQVLLQPPSGYYVAEFLPHSTRPEARAAGWNEVLLTQGYGGRRFGVLAGPGAIRGVVKASGEPVAGVPVYLEGYDPATHSRVTDLKAARTDARGKYYFTDLGPGTYRILSTFEYLAPDVQTLDLIGAQLVAVSVHAEQAVDLDLYVIQ